MKEVPIAFQNEGKQIIGILHLPSTNKSSAVILCHGLLRNKSDKILVDIARKLCKEKFIVLRFDFRGCGDSQGKSEDYCFDSEVSDIDAAIEFLKKVKNFNGNIGILGHSRGGTSVILAAANRNDIKALITIAPVASLKDRWGKDEIKQIIQQGYIVYKGYKVGRKMWLNAQKYNNVINYVKKITCPFMFIVGTEDLNFISDTKTLFRYANEPKKLVFVKGGDHFFTNLESQKILIKNVLQWFRLYL